MFSVSSSKIRSAVLLQHCSFSATELETDDRAFRRCVCACVRVRACVCVCICLIRDRLKIKLKHLFLQKKKRRKREREEEEGINFVKNASAGKKRQKYFQTICVTANNPRCEFTS